MKRAFPRQRLLQYTDELPLQVELDEDESLEGSRNTGSNYNYNNGQTSLPLQIIYQGTQDTRFANDDNGYACELCGRCFPNMIGLRTHKTSHRKTFTNSNAVFLDPAKATAATDIYDIPDLSNYNKEKDEGYSLIVPDLSVEDDEDGFLCIICRRSFPNTTGLRTHQRCHNHINRTPISLPNESPGSLDDDGFTCSICRRSFPNIVGLRTHQRSHRLDVRLNQSPDKLMIMEEKAKSKTSTMLKRRKVNSRGDIPTCTF